MKRTIPNFIFYVFGGVCWFALLGILQAFCIVNIPKHIDGLWVTTVGEDLVENLIGATAFSVDGYGCDDQLIFVAQYYLDGTDEKSETRSLDELIDIASWKKIESDTVSTTYIDNFHKYILLQNSDGIHMKVFKK